MEINNFRLHYTLADEFYVFLKKKNHNPIFARLVRENNLKAKGIKRSHILIELNGATHYLTKNGGKKDNKA